jgi:hypothetical protein
VHRAAFCWMKRRSVGEARIRSGGAGYGYGSRQRCRLFSEDGCRSVVRLGMAMIKEVEFESGAKHADK